MVEFYQYSPVSKEVADFFLKFFREIRGENKYGFTVNERKLLGLIPERRASHRVRKTNTYWLRHGVRPIPVTSILNNPLDGLSKLKSSELRVLNTLIGMSNIWSRVFPSQEYIGKLTGYSRETVNRILLGLESKGLVRSVYIHMKTNVYFLAALFKEKGVRVLCHRLLPALVFGCLSMITQCNIDYIKLLSLRSKHPTLFSLYTNVGGSEKVINNGKEQKSQKEEESIRSCPLVVCPYCKRTFNCKEQNGTRSATENMELRNMLTAISTWKPTPFSSVPLDLTLFGKAKLSLFPVVVLREAFVDFKNSHKKRIKIINPFAYFFFLCKRHCDNMKLTKNYSLYEALVAKHKLSYDADPINTMIKTPTLHISASKITSEPLIQTPFVRPTRGPYALWKGYKDGSGANSIIKYPGNGAVPNITARPKLISSFSSKDEMRKPLVFERIRNITWDD